MIELLQEERSIEHIPVAKIKVLGVGGAGGNTLNWMVESGYHDVEFIAVNTDAQALQLSKAHYTIQIGNKSTKGLGAGANPEIGKRSAEEDIDKVIAAVQDADIVFLTGGLGGGTGSGALPVIAQALREQGILTIVVITKPFSFEGRRRAGIAENALEKIKDSADTLLVIPNQNLLQLVNEKVSMIQAFQMINDVLNQCVRGIADIITRPGHINVDFADVREIMKNQGLAVMGTGRAAGPDRAREASLKAISSPLLENMSIMGARGVLLNITGNSSLSLHEISAAASVIYEQADPDANIILGSVIDDSLDEEIFVTVIATGFDSQTQTPEIKNVTSLPTEPKRRETVSTYSFNHAPHKSTYTAAEPKTYVNTPSKNPHSTAFVKEAPIARTQVQPSQETLQQHKIEAMQPTRNEIHSEIRHEQRAAAPQEIRVEKTPQQTQQQKESFTHYAQPVRYEAVAKREAELTTSLPQAPQPQEDISHNFQEQECINKIESLSAQQEQAMAPIENTSNDIETPAYLRKNNNNQQFNWNKFNNKKFKKHKFQ